MSEPLSNIGDEEQSYQQSPTKKGTFEFPFEGIKTELHTIVDKLQLDEPSGEPPRRPLWQRALVWQIPIWLIAFLIVLSYNPRVDNCNGVKITYRTQTLCIANEDNFFLFVENLACDVIDKGNVMADSLTMDSTAAQAMQNYFTKHNFSLEIQPTEAEVLRGMRNAGYDSTSFCKNVAVAFWNAGVRYLGEGKKDSACLYFNKLEQWVWKDSILTQAELAALKQVCATKKPAEVPIKPPTNPNDFVQGECCTVNFNSNTKNMAWRKRPLTSDETQVINQSQRYGKQTQQSIEIDNNTMLGALTNGQNVTFLEKQGDWFKIKNAKTNQIGYLIAAYGRVSTLIKGCKTQAPPQSNSTLFPNKKLNTNPIQKEPINRPNINTTQGIDPKSQATTPSAQITQAPIVQTTTEYINKVAFDMVKVKGGTFQMGDVFGEGDKNELPVHTVTLSDFSIGATEVTQAQWKAVMGSNNNPSNFKGDDLPVESVNWSDTQGFLRKLNSLSKTQYRLPTEAEWEYAAREGGKKVRFGNGRNIADPKEINFNGSANYKQSYSVVGVYRAKTTLVRSFSPNALGLYDMSGNVWEYCQDDSNLSPKKNESSNHVLRGGSWGNDGNYCRASVRYLTNVGNYNDGFRLAVRSN